MAFMKRKSILTISTFFLLLVSFTACTENNGKAENNSKSKGSNIMEMEEITAGKEEDIEKDLDKIQISKEDKEAVGAFTLSILKKSMADNEDKNQNTLISGISILPALGMCQNGADGETLKQMENTLGMNKDVLNKFCYHFKKNLESGEHQPLFMANSIWFKDSEKLSVEKDFLQVNKDVYDSQIFKAPFDEGTLKEINNWVSENTNGMIDEILDRIEENSVLYLVNGIYFTDTWEEEYEKGDLWKEDFMQEDYSIKKVDFMHSNENIYLENQSSTGFIKPYKNPRFAFVALLPKQGMKMEEYLKSLTWESIHEMMEDKTYEEVISSIPKFKSEYSIELKHTLESLGMTDAFDFQKADFKKMAHSDNGNIFISKVLHKTYIELDEKGTKAAASTVDDMEDGAAVELKKIKEVKLDRPFVYMIYDLEEDLPIFMGALMKVE